MSSPVDVIKGYAFANLWMNLAKILIVFMAIYQATLGEQLGVNMFNALFYVFHPQWGVHASQAENRGDASQDNGTEADLNIRQNNTKFTLPFLPLSISARYDFVEVEVLRVERKISDDSGEGNDNWTNLPIDTGEGIKNVAFPWDEIIGKQATSSQNVREGNKLLSATFDLGEIVKDPLQAGFYEVTYQFKFLVKNDPEPLRRMSEHTVILHYSTESELHFGDFPVVQGQWFRIPQDLLNRKTEYTEYRSTTTGVENWSQWKEGNLLEDAKTGRSCSPERFCPTGVTAGRTYEQKGYYLEGQHQVDLTVSFIVVENVRPRSTYLGPNQDDMYSVVLYSHRWWDAFDNNGKSLNYQYFNLSRHLIDPDGKKVDRGEGTPDVHISSDDVRNLRQPSNHFSLVEAQDGTRDVWLKINGSINQIIPRGGREELELTVEDEVNQGHPMRIIVRRP